MLDWDDFRLFLALEREQTLSGAARRLGVDQSTASRRLQTLEREAGARLFARDTHGYTLTTAGQAVRGGIEEIEGAALRIERLLLGRDARLEGQVRLATSDSLAVWFLVPRLAAFAKRHPGISVELVTGNPPADLAQRAADLSLRLNKPLQPQLVARRLGLGGWALYASRDYIAKRGSPKPKERLNGHDVIAPSAELSSTAGALWLATHGARGRKVFESNSLLSLAAAVKAGLGVCPLPCVFGDQEPEVRRALPGLIGHHEIWLVVHPDVKDSARVRAVADYLTESVLAEVALLSGRHANSRG
ncbi:MAG TPA: LysR family transcriptional regulator [Polyangiaceae bacterium]|jgi:DNA-binding transcriptional LysR family regulator|nr:LysR family transcriptional regulator [Polyangiaceae bacterium]